MKPNDRPTARLTLRLTLARATAWALLLSGWIGIGSFAFVLAGSHLVGFGLVALWLLGLGIGATVATRGSLREPSRTVALALCAFTAAAALVWATRGGGLTALLLALVAWAGLTALASGVVRGLRLAQPAPPGPPIVAASLGAVVAALALADPADLPGLALRLGALVLVAAAVLGGLQAGDDKRLLASRCRAGLFDCSLPAWPAGAWRDPRDWPALLAGLAMLPMMASLPLMVAWCRAESIPPQAMVALHLVAMFAPALALRGSIRGWSQRRLAAVCAACLAAGAVAAVWAAAPLNLIGLAAAHGAAWSMAWAGQLWAPDRRSRQGASPLRAALGYAALTLAIGALVQHFGAAGVTGAHAALGLGAALAWGFGAARLRSLEPGSRG